MMIMDYSFTLPPIQVCTKEEQEILQRDSNKSLKLRKKLMGGWKQRSCRSIETSIGLSSIEKCQCFHFLYLSHGGGLCFVESSDRDYLPHQETRMNAGLEKALQHKDKLLEYDKNRYCDINPATVVAAVDLFQVLQRQFASNRIGEMSWP